MKFVRTIILLAFSLVAFCCEAGEVRWDVQISSQSQRAVVRSLTSDGNSSTPVFLILGDRPVLLFAKHGAIVGTSDTWWTAWGPPLTLHIDQIQNQINAWESSRRNEYQLNILDLSDYPQLPRKK